MKNQKRVSLPLFGDAKNKIRFCVALLASIAETIIILLIAWVLQQVTDVAMGTGNTFSVGTILLIMIGLMLSYAVLNMIVCLTKPRFIACAMENYKSKALEVLVKKQISAFSHESTSFYISALSNDAQMIEDNIHANLIYIVTLCVQLVGAFTIMLLYSPMLTLISLAFSLFPVLASLIIGNRLSEAEKNVAQKNEGYTAAIKEFLEGFSVIKSFKAEKQLLLTVKQMNQGLHMAKCRRARVKIIISLISTMASFVVQFGILFLSAYLIVIEGSSITMGIVMAFVQLLNYVLDPISSLPKTVAEIRSGYALVKRLESALEENHDDSDKVDIFGLNDRIEIKDLTFGYEEDKPVLKDLSFTFESGRAYAVVGGSGSGKSTLLSLLTQSSQKYEGSIKFDGIEMRDISCGTLYDTVSMISQNVFVFNSTLRNNITMFSEADEEKLQRAIELSGLSHLEAERGVEYLCGENGNALSGGERQRISIARSLLRNSSVLLADEATASLDKENAAHVTNSLLDLEGLTRIIVTHALLKDQLERYDCIIAIKDGRIVESGSFSELMERKGYFYSLYTISQ